MIDIATYIRELLFSHDCVILPSFGGFIANYKPAGIDNATHTFTPPVKAISFNRNLNNNDGLLIGRISADRVVGYADSKRIVEQFVDDLKKKLARGERVTIERIGFFQNNSEGSVQFEPDPDSNYLLDSYGLTSFRREPVQDFSLSGKVISRRDKSSASGYSSGKMVWRAVIAVPFIAAMILVPLKTDLFKGKVSMNPLTATEFEDNRRSMEEAAESFVSQPVTEEETGSAIESIDITREEPEISPVADVPHSFCVVAGSFRDHNNALRLVSQAAEKGYSAEIIRAENDFFRVTVVSASSYNEAIRKRDNLRNDFPETWIWKR